MKVLSLVCVLSVALLGTAVAQTPATTTAPAKKAPATTSAKKAPATASKAARTVELTAGDTMKYDKAEIPARPGETLHVVLKNTGAMPKIAAAHNFVVLKLGTDQAAFNTAAFNARETDFIPPDMKSAVIANTPLAGPGETVETTFKVPAKAGQYPYLCSFPGHFALGMRGTLIVK
jgi:azurin